MPIWSLFKSNAKPKRNTAPDPPKKDLIGEIECYFRKVGVAVIKVKKGPLKRSDSIWIKGYTTDVKLSIQSMQIDHKPVETAKKGASVGIKVKQRVRGGDRVYRIANQ